MVPAASLEATFDATLLHPPADVVSAASSFYPPELFKTEKRVRDYLIEKQLADRSGHRSYQDQSAVRPPDQLDRLFRGPLGTEEDLDFIYRPNPKAGECMHSKNTWKSVLSHSGTHTATLSLIPTHCDSLEDDLATANPSLDKQRAKVEQLFQANSKWIQLQKVSMRQTNDRFEHLVFLLKVRLDSTRLASESVEPETHSAATGRDEEGARARGPRARLHRRTQEGAAGRVQGKIGQRGLGGVQPISSVPTDLHHWLSYALDIALREGLQHAVRVRGGGLPALLLGEVALPVAAARSEAASPAEQVLCAGWPSYSRRGAAGRRGGGRCRRGDQSQRQRQR